MEESYVFDLPNLTQSWFHMMLIYYALRLDIAIGVLRDSHRDQWPRYWFRNLRTDIESAGWVLSAYAGRQTAAPPTARSWLLMINAGREEDMVGVIQQSERLNRDALAALRHLLPDWHHNNSWPTFGMDNPWWHFPLREYHLYYELHTPDKAFKRAYNYFNGMWPKTGSPLDEIWTEGFVPCRDAILSEMRLSLSELRATEAEMQECLKEVECLKELKRSAT